jgi:NAD(P)-dependent dehydrogenase (short-subunit alcohol dehydrogenase family)
MAKQQQVALVTGGGRGIGRAMVLGLLQHGFHVAAVDRDEAPLAELAALAGPGAALLTLARDIARPETCAAVVASVRERLGGICVLVNNAGVGQGSIRPDNWRRPIRFWEVSPEDWRRFAAVNVEAIHTLSSAAVPDMLAAKWGRIINVTTSLGTMLRGGYVPYGPTKASAEALTGVMAEDLAGTGVTANVLVPGGVTNTTLVPDDAGFDRAAMLQPAIMVPPLLWLVSAAADVVNGQRFLAAGWDSALPVAEAATQAGAPVGWKSIATLPIVPR